MKDTRNVIDRYKNVSQDKIIEDLDRNGIVLEVAIENTLRDYNMGTIVRNANAFGVRHVHIIGRRQWNKRGAMMTDTYLHLHYHKSLDEFVEYATKSKKTIIAIENNVKSESIMTGTMPKQCIMVFGQEGPGLSQTVLDNADLVLHIPQHGSTRSMNVGVASGIALYEWSRRFSQHVS